MDLPALTMTDHQIGLIMAIKGDVGHVFSGAEELTAYRMVRLGWLTSYGGGRFGVLPKGEIAYRERINGSERMLRIKFTRGVNLDLHRVKPSRKERWRFVEENELWITKMIAQVTQPTTYMLHLVGGEAYLLDVPFNAFEVVEAKRVVT